MGDKRSRLHVMAPMSQGPSYSIELLIISVVITSSSIEVLTKIKNRPLGLDLGSPNPYSTCSTFNLKQLIKVR